MREVSILGWLVALPVILLAVAWTILVVAVELVLIVPIGLIAAGLHLWGAILDSVSYAWSGPA